MPDRRRKYCKHCGGHTDDVGELSWNGLCIEHSKLRLVENVADMVTHSGPNFEKWRRQMAASVGGVLLDDVLPKP